MIRSSMAALFAWLVFSPTGAYAQAEADTVLKNGAIYTVNEVQPWAEAVAIEGDSIVFVGSNTEVAAFEGPGTEVIDLEGRMAMPGIHDSHNHLLEVFHAAWTCGVPFGLRPEEYLPFLSQCSPFCSSPGRGWCCRATSTSATCRPSEEWSAP